MTNLSAIDQLLRLHDNHVIVGDNQWSNSECDFRGTGNTLRLEEGARCYKSSIVFFGSGSTVSVGRSSRLSGKVSLGHACTIDVGADCTITARLELSAAEGTTIHIGADCMFGLDCEILTHDFHPFYDLETGARLNPSGSVIVGDHVWVGSRASIRKGVNVGSGSIVGAGAIVLHDVPPNSVVVGAPAKIVRSNVHWTRDSLRTMTAPLR